MVVPELRKLVSEDSDHGLRGGELGPETEGEQHQEEEDAPERRYRHPGHSLRVSDERQTRSLGRNILYLEIQSGLKTVKTSILLCSPPRPTHEP